MKNKLFMGLLTLAVLAAPQLSYADWGVRVHDRDHYYRWHEHPQWGLHVHYLPAGYLTVRVGWHNYYYYDGLYYNNVNGEYMLCQPPVGAYVSVIPADFQPALINGRTYYTDNGIYYVRTRRGYEVVAAPVIYRPTPVVVAQPASAVDFPVNVPNGRGGYVTVVLKRSGHGYVGPQGEYYPDFQRVGQLRDMYGR